ncbi:hypothetical protein RSAG8_02816, partial [Rhizoctonia solani AG-8 WAC10335]
MVNTIWDHPLEVILSLELVRHFAYREEHLGSGRTRVMFMCQMTENGC